jgi:microcin C transport system substrate-binding protein
MLKKAFLSFFLVFFIFSSSCYSKDQEIPSGSYGISLYGDPLKYGPDFQHFNHVNPSASKGGKASLSAPGSFDSFNPFVVKGQPAAGLTPLFPSLLHVTLMVRSPDEPSAYYGFAAETIQKAEDNTWVIFTLRPNITFHDDTPITADDVVYTFNKLTQEGSPLYKAYYGTVLKVEGLDNRRIKFTFKDGKSREQALILGEMPILSKKYFEKKGFEKADLALPVGSGPYQIASFEAGHNVTYKRIKNWWGEKLPVNIGRYNFDEIRFDYYRDEVVAFEAFKSHAYNFRIENTSKNWAREYTFSAVKEGKVIQYDVNSKHPKPAQVLVLNLRKNLFKDMRVRQALNYALDFEWMNKNLFYGVYKRLHSYFEGSELAATGLPEGDELKALESFRDKLPAEVFSKPFVQPENKDRKDFRKNLEKAQVLLKEAGFKIENNRLIDPHTHKPFKFELLLSQPALVRVGQFFKDALDKLGIELVVRLVDAPQYELRSESFDFDAIIQMIPQSSSPGNEQREYWSSAVATLPGSRNFSGVQDSIIDVLIQNVIDASDRPSLIANTRALDRVLLWGYKGVLLWYSPATHIAYWNELKHPDKMPDYEFDFYSWWSQS